MSGIECGTKELYYAGNGVYQGNGPIDTLPPTISVRARKLTIKPGTNDLEFAHLSLFGNNFKFTNIPLNKGRDIAWDEKNNVIWLATNATGDPIRGFNQQSQVVGSIPSSIGIGNNICGLTMTYINNHRIIWASDLTTNKIYKIDLDPATIIHNQTMNDATTLQNIVCRVDPFTKKVIFKNTDMATDRNVLLTISTVQGENVLCVVFKNRYVWNVTSETGKRLAQGVYISQVTIENKMKNMLIHTTW